MSWQDSTKIAIVLFISLIIIWDIIAFSFAGPPATISRIVLKYSCDFPLIPLAIGVLLGHVFSSQQP